MAIEVQSLSYLSANGMHTIHAVLWSDSSRTEAPRGIVQFVHGMAEHIGRYDDLARFLVAHGFAVCGNDHIGHGKSVPDKSYWGVMPLRGGPQILVDDVHALRTSMQERFGQEVPYFIYGHSMGSFIARAYIASYADGLAGTILSGTANNPARACQLAGYLARRHARKHGIDSQNALIQSMADGAYSSAVKNARTSYDWLSHDESVVDTYIADEMSGFPFKVGGYATLMDLCEFVGLDKSIDPVPLDLPIYLIAGAEDPVGSNGKGVREVYQRYVKNGSTDIELRIYENMRHEVHNEINKDMVYNDVLTWLEGRE